MKHHTIKTAAPLLLLLLIFPTAAAAQSTTISTTDHLAYAANAGWIDCRPSAAEGVRVADTCLAGFAYAANFGWISLGTGLPANGHTYGNTSALDYGVNLSPTGQLIGSAYAANVGWITFEQAQGRPRLDLLTGKFTGHAYSANLGWISLDTASSDLTTVSISRPDTDGDGIPDLWENLHWGNLTTATATTDSDGDGTRDSGEYLAGTLPLDATSQLRITQHTYASGFTQADLTWTITPSRLYRLEYDDDLLGPWTDSALGTIAPAAAATATRSLTGLPATARRFFRAAALLPLPSN